MQITSSAINTNEQILEKYGCEGENVNPPITFSDIPANTQSLVLIMDDPDAPGGTFTHWILYNMSPATLQLNENALPPSTKTGLNSFGQIGYGGPCPPPGQTHHYYFKLYALSQEVDLENGASLEQVKETMKDCVIEQAQIIGEYKRN